MLHLPVTTGPNLVNDQGGFVFRLTEFLRSGGRRAALAAAGGFLAAPLALICTLAAPGALGASCDTGSFALRGDYPGARLSSCQVLSANRVEIGIQPEDEGPINPSPWYGFHVKAHSADAGELRIRLRYTKHKHRYAPKISVDGTAWRLAPEADVEVSEDGGALIRLRPGLDGLYVSAQENLGEAFYAAWGEWMQQQAPDAQKLEIGQSLGGRPIHGFITNPEAGNYLLLIGRQHPPEVTGALAMTSFVKELLKLAATSCPAQPARCLIFQTHGLVVVPLLNPDGVAEGHWRHNLGQVDLNRDWGPFTQPETLAVKELVDDLERRERRLRLVLDFHSTRRNVFFTQDDEAPASITGLVKHWLAEAKSHPGLYEFDHDPRGLYGRSADQRQASAETEETPIHPTSKNYFYVRFGVPSITYEVADAEDRERIAVSSAIFARELVDALAEDAVFATFSGCADFFCHMLAVNTASLVMLREEGLLAAEQAASIAEGLSRIGAEQGQAGAKRWSNYLHLEARLVELAGISAADLHMGRSRQDLHGTVRRLLARDQWLEVFAALLEARARLIELAATEANTPVPAYTHGVQAQPTTFGHYLLAFSAGLARDAERLMQSYQRLNRSSLGAAALSTSGLSLNRQRLAELLGFDEPVENSYDANLLATADYKLEFANHLELSAITIGQFVENLHTQYHDPQPWIRLHSGMTSISTIMPQKRNPRPLDRLRSAASRVVGDAHAMTLLAHNTNTGMHDYRQIAPLLDLTERALDMYGRYAELVSGLDVDARRAREELDRGYSTMTEVADTLLREAGVPFRSAHAYASALSDFCRAEDRRAATLSDRELEGIYQEVMGGKLPVPARVIRQAFDPAALIAKRQGFGGPQPKEMERSIASHRDSLAQAQAWLMDRQHQLGDARIKLRHAFVLLNRESLSQTGE